MKYSVLIQVSRGPNQKLAAWLAIVAPVHDVEVEDPGHVPAKKSNVLCFVCTSAVVYRLSSNRPTLDTISRFSREYVEGIS